MNDKTFAAFGALDPAVLESFVQSNRTAMKGFERLSQYFFETARQNFDTAVETSKRIASVKTLPELAELQGKLSQEFFETVTQRNKTATEMGATMMRDATTQAGVQLHAGGQVVDDLVAASGRRPASPKVA